MQVVTEQGRTLKLGNLLGKGGEANVFDVEGNRDIVAKIYHAAPSREKLEKISWMTRLATPELSKFAAWPLATIHQRSHVPAIGILMPRVENASEIHELYGPAHRRTAFPSADWRFLIRAARNCAAAFATLHSKSVVIGDVNQGNLLVTRDAIIKMIDCDSFQLSGNGKLFRCTVGVPHFQPPELQTARFDSVIRTPNHDNFGLAVLLFHLLFMGRHPFSVRPLDREDISIEAAIKHSRFPYGRLAAQYRVAPPPHSLQLTNLNSQLASYFEAAFSSNTLSGGRPTAAHWAKALALFETSLTKCQADAGHVYFGAVNACPWCNFERSGGPDFFVSVSVARVSTAIQTFDFEKTWLKIASIQSPQARFRPAARIPANSVPAVSTPPTIQKEIKFQKLLKNIAWGGVFASVLGMFYGPILVLTGPVAVLFGLCYLVISSGSSYGAYKQEKKNNVNAKRSQLADLTSTQQAAATRGQAAFDQKFRELKSSYQAYKSLANRFAQAKQSLHADSGNRQLEEWLDRCYISGAQLSGIGPGRVATLQSYGIETAKDVTRGGVSRIPGFGPRLTATLVAWRRVCESRFTFDPSKGPPASDIQKLERTFSIERSRLMRTLENGAKNLEQISLQTNDVVSKMDVGLSQAEYELAKAEKELASCP
ncbi:MAG: hypothetical protein O3C17_21335 [Planctomycetota bacterium]|nr:hypothetical protein [Planctomycetota bacterium]